jgi:uncharacterized membrane protein
MHQKLAESKVAVRAQSNRLESIDIVRGLIMVLMTIDHVRDHVSGAPFDPLDLDHTTTAWFFTRWITHYCAPNFVFLAGVGAFLYGSRGRTSAQLSRFLLSRGLWLVLLDITVVKWSWGWGWDYVNAPYMAGVLWAIGWSMVALSGLVFLPLSAITTFGVLMIGYHNLFDWVTPEHFDNYQGLWQWVWGILHKGTVLEGYRGIKLHTAYPLVPWIGVMAAGYGFGSLYLLQRQVRRKQLLGLGIALTLAFVALRYSNLYGNPKPWTHEENRWLTFLSFIDCEKYPPSLLYLLMTIGPSIALLGILDGVSIPGASLITVFGRVPLFFYLLHVPLIHWLSIGVRFVWPPKDVPFWLAAPGGANTAGYGLPMTYLLWLPALLILWPLCWWFAGLKARHKSVWLSYL